MNEYQRMQYLEAIGVETFVPRMTLPNARPSLQCIVPDTAPKSTLQASPKTGSDKDILGSASTAANEAALSQDALRSLNEGLSSVLSDLDLDARTPSKLEKSLDSKEPKPALDNSSRDSVALSVTGGHRAGPALESVSKDSIMSQKATFNLALWYTDSHIQVIDSRQPQDALPTETLLNNILVATGMLKAGLPTTELQSWPLPGSADQSWHAAAAMLNDFLSFRYESKPVRGFVLFGEDAAKAMLGEHFDFGDRVFSKTTANDYNVETLVLPSLRDLLYAPQSKRKLWPLMTSFLRS